MISCINLLTITQGHGCLNDIYSSVERAAAFKGWDGVDLVIVGGDFQVGCILLSCLDALTPTSGGPQFQ